MKIADLLAKESIDLQAKVGSKAEALEHLVTLMAKSGKLADEAEYKRCVLAREEEGSTGIGEGIAIPHAKTNAVKAPGLAAMIVSEGVDFASLDDQPAKLFFLIAAPDTEDNVHLDVLSRLSTLLMDEEFTTALYAAKSPKEFLSIIDKFEADKLAEEAEEAAEQAAEAPVAERLVLAVTACPTGIAHIHILSQSCRNAAG